MSGKPKSDNGSWLFWVVLAVAVIGFPLASLGHVEYCVTEEDCDSFFTRFLKQQPAGIGDTLAGFFGSLAFLVAAIAIILQSRELAAQREELRLTRAEMTKQREATQGMEMAVKAQTVLLEDEKNRRDQKNTEALLEQKLDNLINQILESENIVWRFPQKTTGNVAYFGDTGEYLFDHSESLEKTNTDSFLRTQFRRVADLTELLSKEECRSSFDSASKPAAETVLPIYRQLKSIISLQGNLGEDQIERLGKMGVFGLLDHLETLMQLPIWGDFSGEAKT